MRALTESLVNNAFASETKNHELSFCHQRQRFRFALQLKQFRQQRSKYLRKSKKLRLHISYYKKLFWVVWKTRWVFWIWGFFQNSYLIFQNNIWYCLCLNCSVNLNRCRWWQKDSLWFLVPEAKALLTSDSVRVLIWRHLCLIILVLNRLFSTRTLKHSSQVVSDAG